VTDKYNYWLQLF